MVKGTHEQDAKEQEKTLTVPEAGWRYYRLSLNGSYDAVKRGDIPVIRVGGKMRFPVIAMERRLAEVR
jgi:hypothetical protein